MEITSFSRKIDNIGRIVIPSKLRLQLGIKEDDVLDFYIHEQDGRKFLCMDVGLDENNSEIEKAKRLLEEAGYSVN